MAIYTAPRTSSRIVRRAETRLEPVLTTVGKVSDICKDPTLDAPLWISASQPASSQLPKPKPRIHRTPIPSSRPIAHRRQSPAARPSLPWRRLHIGHWPARCGVTPSSEDCQWNVNVSRQSGLRLADPCTYAGGRICEGFKLILLRVRASGIGILLRTEGKLLIFRSSSPTCH